ncbi:MAG: hypothetical protein M3209_00115 [Acidobacteriota bacterium]|nr:hypothetical protein [Acidobacteriota bacterium]
MSKQALLHNLSSNGVNFGRKMRAEDITRLQTYAHDHVNTFVADIVAKATRTIVAFDFIKPDGTGNERKMIVNPGRVYDAAGLQYTFATATELTFDAADATLGNNRLDLVVAKIEPDAEIENAPIPVQRIRTQAEIEGGDPQYMPTELPAAQTRINRVTVSIKKGEMSSTPTPPNPASDEVSLYVVNIPGGSTIVRLDDIVDARKTFRTQVEQDEFMNKLRADLEALILRVIRLEMIEICPIDWGGEIRSLRDIIREFRYQIAELSRTNPEIVRAGLSLADPNNGKLDASGDVDNGVPCVDVELGAHVRFATSEHPVTASRFLDATRNARIVNVAGDSASSSLTTQMNLQNIVEIDSDGGMDFVKRNAELPSARYAPAICSRGAGANQGNFVEIFGGAHISSGTGLGDWKSYDVVNDVLLNRAYEGATPPNSGTPVVIPYGNGTLLLGAPSYSGASRWFRLNAETSECVELSGTLPQGTLFFGDKITHDKIFVVVPAYANNPATAQFWVYDINTHSFTQIAPAGNVPVVPGLYSSGCYFRMGHFVLVEFADPTHSNSNTYVFEYASLTWRKLNIPSPRPVTASLRPEEDKRQLSLFKMANVAGRILLAGGSERNAPSLQTYLGAGSVIWELKVANYTSGQEPLQHGWDYRIAPSYPGLWEMGFCSTYTPAFKAGARQSPIVDRAVSVGGADLWGRPTKYIYSSILGGLIATSLNGVAGITLADTANFAEFVLPMHTADWDVAEYFLHLAGKYSPGQVEVHVSFDDGVNFHAVTPEVTKTITDSTAPGKRHLRVILRSHTYTNGEVTGGSRPILTSIREIFDEDGSGNLNTRSILRFDVVADESIKAVYMNAAGDIYLSTAIEPSAPDICLLMKITPGSGVVAPAVKNYVNRRHARVRHRGTRSGGTGISFDNDLAVVPRWVETCGIKATDRHLYDVANPVVNFDQVVTINIDPGQGANILDGDTWEVELEG